MKTCSRCKEAKPLEDFANQKSSKDGKQYWCRACNTITRTEWARANKKKTQGHTRYHKYRLREEDFIDLIEKQSGLCAICEEEFTGTPYVDHDHSCCDSVPTCGNCVRGLLCSRCNTFVGYIEKKNVTDKAVEYLSKHRVVVA